MLVENDYKAQKHEEDESLIYGQVAEVVEGMSDERINRALTDIGGTERSTEFDMTVLDAGDRANINRIVNSISSASNLEDLFLPENSVATIRALLANAETIENGREIDNYFSDICQQKTDKAISLRDAVLADIAQINDALQFRQFDALVDNLFQLSDTDWHREKQAYGQVLGKKRELDVDKSALDLVPDSLKEKIEESRSLLRVKIIRLIQAKIREQRINLGLWVEPNNQSK